MRSSAHVPETNVSNESLLMVGERLLVSALAGALLGTLVLVLVLVVALLLPPYAELVPLLVVIESSGTMSF